MITTMPAACVFTDEVLADLSMAEFVGLGGTYMMTLSPETEIVSTQFDEQARICHYTVAREGKRWTVSIPIDELHKLGANHRARRMFLANKVAAAVAGPCDGERA